MEHRLITGGEEYLPFARSCITKLKKLGLPYADQSYEVGGVSIKVRIEPGHEYIRIDGGGTAYMESGQLEWSGIGEENPERLDPAKWHFLDIPTTDKWLGKASVLDGKQSNNPALTESMDSKAIGYTFPQNATDAEKQVIRDKYEDQLILKKFTASQFTPSLWSGKMRLFMQALYGARMTDKDPLTINLVGTEIVLVYIDTKSGESVQFGLWSHDTPGILYFPKTDTTSSGYWFIRFTNPTATRYIITAAPMIVNSTLSRIANNPKMTAETRRQAEAYMFSSARIDLANTRTVKEFDAKGSALAYGWKFQFGGTRASIVTNEVLGLGYNDLRWTATTIHCDFSCVYDEEKKRKDLTVQVTQTPHGEWTDGWGVYNIFAPEYVQYSAPLELVSLKINAGEVKPDFDFSDIPVYGYYDASDTWVDVKLSREYKEFAMKLEQSESGVTYDPLLNMNQTWRIYQGISQGGSFTYEQHQTTKGTYMTLSVGGASYAGKSEYGTHDYQSRSSIGGGSTIPNPVNFASGYLGSPTYIPPSSLLLPPQSGVWSGGTHNVTVTRLREVTTTYVGWSHHAWAFVIPGQDCSAVYVATHGYDSTEGTHTTQATEFNSLSSFSGNTVDGGGTPGVSYDYAPWIPTSGTPSWYGVVQDIVTTTTPEDPPTMYTYVYCHNSFMNGEEGVPGGSYEPLFIVDRNWAFYNRGMYMHTSAGGRYAMSEHANSPISVNYQHRFVGWA